MTHVLKPLLGGCDLGSWLRLRSIHPSENLARLEISGTQPNRAFSHGQKVKLLDTALEAGLLSVATDGELI